jgi:hypothetical protein
MFATVYLTVKSVQTEVKKGFKATDLFHNKVFSTLILSMLSTYVLWFVVSFLFFDAWHMFTSFFQYLLMTPSYINILNVYALCNTHDLSWGTKGDDKPPGGGSVKSGGENNTVDKLAVPVPDIQYDEELAILHEEAPEEKEKINPIEEKKFYYASIRSWIVIGWIFSNLALCTLVLKAGSFGVITKAKTTEEEAEQRNSGKYLFVVLWSVAGLAAFRFAGALWFLVHRKVSFMVICQVELEVMLILTSLHMFEGGTYWSIYIVYRAGAAIIDRDIAVYPSTPSSKQSQSLWNAYLLIGKGAVTYTVFTIRRRCHAPLKQLQRNIFLRRQIIVKMTSCCDGNGIATSHGHSTFRARACHEN